MIKIAIIGYGYWGPNLVRNFFSIDDVKIISVVEPNEDRIKLLQKSFPGVQVYSDSKSVFTDPSIDAVVIATPVNTHFDLAKSALLSGKHVLVEKPLAMTAAEGKELINLSLKMNKVLMVDHTFLYTGAIQKIHSLIEAGEIGKIKYFDSTRINLGLFQSDVNVLWDLASHDLSILSYINNETPYSVNATGFSHTHNGIENIAYMTLNYQSDLMAHINCSWTSPVKIRMTLIGGDKKMIVYNDMEPTEKIKVYTTGYTHTTDEDKRKILVDYRVGDIYVPKLDTREALDGMAKDFIKAIAENYTPLSSAELGLKVVQILEASQISIKNKGKEVMVNY